MLESILERFQFPWNLKAALSLCIVAFSRREVVSASLENALDSAPRDFAAPAGSSLLDEMWHFLKKATRGL